jgi:hypothetical protein
MFGRAIMFGGAKPDSAKPTSRRALSFSSNAQPGRAKAQRRRHIVERQRCKMCEPNDACEPDQGQRKGSQSGGYRRRITRDFCRTVSPYRRGYRDVLSTGTTPNSVSWRCPFTPAESSGIETAWMRNGKTISAAEGRITVRLPTADVIHIAPAGFTLERQIIRRFLGLRRFLRACWTKTCRYFYNVARIFLTTNGHE